MDFNPELLIRNLDADFKLLTSELKSYKGAILKKTLFKKFVESASASVQLDREARADFIRRNKELQQFRVPESELVKRLAVRLDIDLNSEWDGVLCTSYLLMSKVVARGTQGSGAGLLAPRNDFLSKMFDKEISTTNLALHRYFLATAPANWAGAFRRFPQQAVYVPGGKLSSVPKDIKKNRTICVEPVLNMFYQQGCRAQLEDCLVKRYRIDITTQQDKNKALARIGSIDGKLSTIDLSNASDTITVQLVERILPRNAFATLMAVRSPFYTDGKHGAPVPMNMISTMGNAFTFPLMTLIFTALCHVVAEFCNVKLSDRNFGVYGDDIIVPTVMADALLVALKHLGFLPNQAKSFTTGFFRESCGGDYLRGCDVRGVYLRRMENEADVYSAFNRLHRWSLHHDIPLSNSLRYLITLAKFRPVPRHESVDSGFILSSQHLQCPKRDPNGAIMYKIVRSRDSIRTLVGDDTYNPLGAKICAVGGYVRDNKISSRSYSRKLTVVKRKTPCWDYSNDSALVGRGLADSWNQLLS